MLKGPTRGLSKSYLNLVHQAEMLALASLDKPFHIAALCHELAVSERTLRKAFRITYGLEGSHTLACRQAFLGMHLVLLDGENFVHSLPSWCLVLSSSRGAGIQVSTSAGVVRITGIAFGWMAPTSAFGRIVRYSRCVNAETAIEQVLGTSFHGAPDGRQLTDLSADLAGVGDRDVGFPLPHGGGDEFHHGSPGIDPRSLPPKGPKPRDIYVPDLYIDSIKVKTRDFR